MSNSQSCCFAKASAFLVSIHLLNASAKSLQTSGVSLLFSKQLFRRIRMGLHWQQGLMQECFFGSDISILTFITFNYNLLWWALVLVVNLVIIMPLALGSKPISFSMIKKYTFSIDLFISRHTLIKLLFQLPQGANKIHLISLEWREHWIATQQYTWNRNYSRKIIVKITRIIFVQGKRYEEGDSQQTNSVSARLWSSMFGSYLIY